MSEAREPEDVVEGGCRAVYGKSWDGPLDKEPGPEMKEVWRNLVRKAQSPIAAAITSERALVAELVEALKPFAAVLVDIGDDETDADTFQPMSPKNANAPLLTVGDFRRIAAALTRAGAIHE